MNINGYEVTSIAFMAGGGALWNTADRQGVPALLTLRAPDQGERLRSRWRAWAGIDSPYVAHLQDAIRHDDGRWAIVMERVPGETLEVLFSRGLPRQREQRDLIAHGVREGLRAWHGAGLVHGDVSPANIVVRPDGCPVLIDLIDDPAGRAGTPGWSLEQAGSRAGDLAACGRIADALSGPPTGSGVGADQVLRGVATSAQTVRLDAPARHRGASRWRGRPPVILAASALAAAVAAAVVGTGVVGGPQLLRGATADVRPVVTGVAAGAGTPRCPGPDQVLDIVAALTSARDAALEAGDIATIADFGTGAAAEADRALLEALSDAGVRVEHIRSEVVGVGAVTCGATSVTLTARISQAELRQCRRGGTCADVPARAARDVRMTLVPDPWRVSRVSPLVEG